MARKKRVDISNPSANKYRNARSILLVIILFTVINILLSLTESDTYYLISVFLAYFLFSPDVIGIALSLLVLLPYILAYFLSKKKGGWMIAALVMMSLDTLFVLFITVIYAVGVIDIIFHALAVVMLAIGVKNRKEGVIPEDERIAAAAAAAPVESEYYGSGSESAPVSGEAPQLVCSFSVKKPEKKLASLYNGVLQFEASELVIAGVSAQKQMLIGSLGGAKELMRVRYTDILRAEYTSAKKFRDVQLSLPDQTVVKVSTNIAGSKVDKELTCYLGVHGITVREHINV